MNNVKLKLLTGHIELCEGQAIHEFRKGWFSINVQIVCELKMEIYNIVARWSMTHAFSTIADEI